MNKAALIAAGSSLAASCVIYNVWQQKQQFYPTVVHISKSSSCMAVFYIQAFSVVYLFAHIFRKIFFGSLRAAETEHLIERSWYALTETCLAFTVFRDDLSPSFIAQFAVLLFLKAFHWLLEDRIDYMERSPVIGFFFHLRALTLMSILAVCDAFLLSYAAHVTLQKGASVHLVFGFEYAVLLLLVATILVKYILHLIDLRHENQWPNKTIYLLYTELVIGAVKVLMYAMFVTIMIRVHTFPLFVIRPMYLALRQFQKTLVDVIKSRKATYNMRERYPDATPEEISNGDSTCIICREEMTAAKKLPCGHIFHLECLRSWLLRQQTCPTCRIDILQQQQQQANQQNPPPRNNAPPAPGFQGHAHPPPPPPIFTWENNNNNNNNANNNNANNNNANNNNANANNNNAGPSGATPRIYLPTSSSQPSGSFTLSGFAMPPPPPSLHTLSEEELKAFEGSTRQAIENRLLILRNVQMLMEAIQGQMQLYNSVAGPFPASTFVSFSTPPGAAAQPSTTPAAPPATPAAPPATDPPATPYKVVIGDKEEVFGSKGEYEEEIDRRRDTLLREYNLIGDEEYEAGERVREQLRAARLAALDTKPGPSGVVTSSDIKVTESVSHEDVNVTSSDVNVTSADVNVTSSDVNVTSSDVNVTSSNETETSVSSESLVHVQLEDTATTATTATSATDNMTEDNPFSALTKEEDKIEDVNQDGLRLRNVGSEPRED
ncbi:E3 ubiquitin-protein ligase synoviolin B-like [Bolinopsis microptera]|uniref:E3 ubiquitin-protein ligase synoviolin B-like n=1 Tax=Bolinopsis microptera TaxID=2820187 RepID=UPI00307A6BBB